MAQFMAMPAASCRHTKTMNDTTNTPSICVRGEVNEPLDWLFGYKVPKLGKAATGREWAIYTSNDEANPDPKAGAVKMATRHLDAADNALANTLAMLYATDRPATVGYIVWNDEHSDAANKKDNGALGHTKGVIIFDTADGSALYLLHSCPKWPDLDGRALPSPDYGQTFWAGSLSIDTAGKLADVMLHHHEPQITYSLLPASLPADHPLRALVETPITHNTPMATSIDLVTAGGLAFTFFGKNREWNDDIWLDLVEPVVGCDMRVETWIRGPIAPVLSADGHFRTYDVKSINLGPLGIPYSWPETADHAKWGITIDAKWIVPADINRQTSQAKRGGGAVAFKSERLGLALAQTDVITAAAGDSHHDAKTVIKSTHRPPPPTPTPSEGMQKPKAGQ